MGRPREGRLPKGTWGGRSVCLCAALALLAACSGSSSRNYTESEGLVLSGSVGDGPIVGADLLVEDAKGEPVWEGTSDSSASYQVEIPDGTYLPVTVRVSGGTDLVTGRPADFELIGAAFESGPVTLNASPYTTLAVKTARCVGELTPENLTWAWQRIHDTLNLGWDASQISDPMAEPVGEQNVGTLLLSNEALGEVIRRTSAAFAATATPLDNDQVMGQLACDLADGTLDGDGDGVDARVTMAALAAATGVRLEVIAGALQVDGQTAMPLLDSALATIMPEVNQSVANVVPNETLIAQTQDGLGVLRILEDPELMTLAAALEDASPATARGQVLPALTADSQNTLLALPEIVTLADDTLVADLILRQATPAAPPMISFAAEPTAIAQGGGTRLSWATTGAEVCTASGGWSGEVALSGSTGTGPLDADTEFTLSCAGLGGVATERVLVSVTSAAPQPEPTPEPSPTPEPTPEPAPAPDPSPVVTLTATRTTVDAGDSVTLSWSADHASSCSASGGWSGSRTVSGSLTVGPLASNVTFGLTCTGAGGSDSASLDITVIQPMPAPTVNLTSAAYSIDYGLATLLSWTSSNATACTAEGAWSGGRGTSGSGSTGGLTTTSTFTLSCTGPGGTRSDSVTIQVGQPASPTLTLNASSSTIQEGGSATLSWTSENASDCTASGGWSGNRGPNGSASVSPQATTTYGLTCSGDGGSVSDSVAITVEPASSTAPVVSLSLADGTIEAGQTTSLSWSASDATACTASGGWSGSRALSGNQSVAPTQTTTYTLSCTGDGGTDTASATLTVNAQAPTLTFDASEDVVSQAGTVTLTWSSTDTSSCTAGGSWSGNKPINGSELVGPINAESTFSLTCTGPGGNVVEMLTVSAISPVTLGWVAPTENVDGTTLTDLAGFRIYYGTASRAYTDMVEVTSPSATSHTLNLPSGDYHVAMTAMDAEGNESAYSNEVLKSTP